MPETLIQFGSEVKALNDTGRVGGFLVLFGDATTGDLSKYRDYFDAATYYGNHKTSAVIYNHALDEQLKGTVLDCEGALEVKDAGVWIESQLELRDDYEKAVFKMVKDKKLGWSSGTASHLVEREPVNEGKAHHVTRWPLGLDASLTPTPADYRNVAQVVSLKSWDHHLKSLAGLPETKGVLLPGSEEQMLLTALQSLNSMFLRYVMQAVGGADWQSDLYGWDCYSSRKVPDADDGEPVDADMLRAAFDEYRDTALRAVEAMQAMPAAKSAQSLINLFRSADEGDVLTSLKRMTITNFLSTMGAVVAESDRRVSWYDEQRSIKQGRVHSATTLQTLTEIRQGLIKHAETIGGMEERYKADNSNHNGKSIDLAASEYARFLSLESRLLGVGV